MTMADVARKAGVARSTVSHILGGRQSGNVRIPEATRQRVLDAAIELGFRPNALARSVRSGKSTMIGYLVDDPNYEPYWKTIIGSLMEAEQEGYTLKLLSATRDTFAQRIEQCMQLRLAGLIVRVAQDTRPLFQETIRARVPVVMVDEYIPQPFGVRVTADDAIGFHAALSHLVELGHCKIAFLSSGFTVRPPETLNWRESLFLAGMKALGLEVPEGYVAREWMNVYGAMAAEGLDPTSVYSATDALLKHPSGPPTAICCWRDETAIMAIEACQQAGLDVPKDISVIGFSDINAARLCHPSLSTCVSPWEAMGRRAVQELLRATEEEFDPAPRTILLPTSFAARQSSGPAPRPGSRKRR